MNEDKEFLWLKDNSYKTKKEARALTEKAIKRLKENVTDKNKNVNDLEPEGVNLRYLDSKFPADTNDDSLRDDYAGHIIKEGSKLIDKNSDDISFVLNVIKKQKREILERMKESERKREILEGNLDYQRSKLESVIDLKNIVKDLEENEKVFSNLQEPEQQEIRMLIENTKSMLENLEKEIKEENISEDSIKVLNKNIDKLYEKISNLYSLQNPLDPEDN